MADTIREENSQYFVHSLRQHALSPVSTAPCLIDQEYTEITAELESLEKFEKRLTATESISTSSTPPVSTRLPQTTSTTRQIDRIRAAYRETVMSVPHYEEVYGEPLTDHLAAEFDETLAERMQRSGSFTEPFKRMFQAQLADAKHRRQEMVETLDEESQSIEKAHTTLDGILNQLDTTIIPEWYRQKFTCQLDEVVGKRQRLLQNRESEPHLEEHSLCAYLYADEAWSYPVLTSVARIREAVTLE